MSWTLSYTVSVIQDTREFTEPNGSDIMVKNLIVKQMLEFMLGLR